MDAQAPCGLLRYFNKLKDPRVDRTKRHTLTDILTIAVSAVICGAEGWTQVQEFGEAKRKWFQTFLSLPNGIPSHDTFGRVFTLLDPETFERCFLNWIEAVAHKSPGVTGRYRGRT